MSESASEHHSIHVGELDRKGRRITPWAWVPSVYFLQGLQYVIIIQLFVIIYFMLGVSPGMTLLLVGFLQLPYTLKPLWGPLIDRYGAKRAWTYWMQALVGLGFLGVAFALQLPVFLAMTFFILLMLAFAAATHDIACDGYYMMGLNERQQAFHVGVRSTFFRLALIVANGVLVWLAGVFMSMTGLRPVEVMIDAAPKSESAVVELQAPPPMDLETEYTEQAVMIHPPVLTTVAGETTSFTVRLAIPPPVGETQVVAVQPAGGFLDLIGIGPNRFFSVPRDMTRLEFDETNWNTGIDVPVRVDPGLHREVRGSFSASAGNVKLSWAIVVGICGLSFLLIGLYHAFILPYPPTDVIETENRPPFYVPLYCLLVTIGIPTAAAYGLYYGLGYLDEPLKALFIGQDPTALQLKGFNVFFTLGRLTLIVVIGAVLFLVPAFWKPIRGFIYEMSNRSGIGFAEVFGSFFSKPGMGVILGFLLTFRLGEAQLASVKNIFLLDEFVNGGVELTTGQLAFVNTAVYLLALTIGGILGGFLIAAFGLKRVIWPMVACMHLPNFLYIWLAVEQPTTLGPINLAVFVESFGYGFGFAAYLMVMILAAQGPYKTAHYAICTGAMALGYMIPSMWSGFLQEIVGYYWFFILVIIFTLPGVLFIPFMRIDPNFGLKTKST